MRATISAPGTTWASDQRLVLPTSMNSMKRRVCPRSPEGAAEGDDLGVVDPLLDDAVDLDRKTRGGGGIDAGEDPGHAETEAVHPARRGLVQGVNRDIEPVEPGGPQGRGLLFQEPAIGGQRDVLDRGARPDGLDDGGQVAP